MREKDADAVIVADLSRDRQQVSQLKVWLDVRDGTRHYREMAIGKREEGKRRKGVVGGKG